MISVYNAVLLIAVSITFGFYIGMCALLSLED